MDFDTVYKFMKETPIYGRFKVWHLAAFMILGPTLTWPMLIVLLLIFTYENRNIVKDVRSMFSINGDQSAAPGSSGGNQGAPQGPTQGQGASGGPYG